MVHSSIKNISTFFFILFLMIVALAIPTSAIFNNPIFYNDEIKQYSFVKNNIPIFRSEGFYMTNISRQDVFYARNTTESASLYDLYMGFDKDDVFNNYTIIKNSYETNTLQRYTGDNSAKFVTGDNEIVLFPNSESILKNSSSLIQNFTITFQLYPYRVGEGSQNIVSYEGFYTDPIEGVKKIGFSITIESGIINYRFNNLFVDDTGIPLDFIIQEKAPLVNTQWERHTVVVDSALGIITVYRNNEEQGIVFTRENRQYNGRRLYLSPYFSKIENIPLTIGKNGVFSLDDFIIYRDAVTDFMTHTPNQKLFFETEVFKISDNISSLYEMNVDTSSTNSNYRLAYRIDEQYFLPETRTSKKPWIYIDSTKKQFPLTYQQGKFLQWRVEYFTPIEGENNQFYIRDIFARFKETANPGTIQIQSVIAQDGAITLEWRTLPNILIASYEIYYGESPNNYFGKAEISPKSPIAVDIERSSVSTNIQYFLRGLDNEKPYYISIRAKDIYGQYGPFSPEITARPSSVNNELGFSIGR